MKISKNARQKFEWFSKSEHSTRALETFCVLNNIIDTPEGFSALECFHQKESTGKTLPCKEPLEFARALLGKKFHGITISSGVKMLREGLTTFRELENEFPTWVANEIVAQYER